MFSVLISVYAKESPKFFESALNSIVKQTIISNDVVIVMDGILTPELYGIIDGYKSKLNIKGIQLDKNVGLGEALNIGLKHCKNNLVVRCDSDDLNRIDKFEILLKLMQAADSNVAVVGSSINEFIQEGDIVARRFYPVNSSSYSKFYRDPVGHPSVIIRKDLVEMVGGYKHCLFFEDTYLWLRLFAAGYVIQNTAIPLTSMRVGSEFYSRRSGLNYSICEFIAFRMFYRQGLISGYGFLIGCLRSILRLMPNTAIRSLYLRHLRE
jgi:amylovoran biosynthesis glycosyltransferase AmsE